MKADIEHLLANPPVPLALAQKLAATYASRYSNRRGAMVVDVVASAARNYDRVEQTIMPGFERLAHNKPTLEALAKADPAQLKALGLRASEPNTMVEVAKGLIQFGSERTLSLITTQANATVGRIHDRMPVMLRDDVARSIWLDGGAHLDDVAALLGPAPEDFLTPRRVSRLVSNARNEGPDCLAEAGVEGLGLV